MSECYWTPDDRLFLHPGPVRSQNDGQRHFIGAQQLARLWGVPYKHARIMDMERPETLGDTGFKTEPGDLHLYPNRGGNYRHIKKSPTGTMAIWDEL